MFKFEIQTHRWSKRAISRAERTPQSTLPSSIVNRFKTQSKAGPAKTKGSGSLIDSRTSAMDKQTDDQRMDEDRV